MKNTINGPSSVSKNSSRIFLTCEAVLTEALFLLGFAPKAIEQADRFMEMGWLKTPFQFALQRPAVIQLMRTYRNVPISFADACLVPNVRVAPERPRIHSGQGFPDLIESTGGK